MLGGVGSLSILLKNLKYLYPFYSSNYYIFNTLRIRRVNESMENFKNNNDLLQIVWNWRLKGYINSYFNYLVD